MLLESASPCTFNNDCLCTGNGSDPLRLLTDPQHRALTTVCTENLIPFDDVVESLKLAE